MSNRISLQKTLIQSNWVALENVKEGIHFGFLTSGTDLHLCSEATDKQINDRKFPVFSPSTVEMYDL